VPRDATIVFRLPSEAKDALLGVAEDQQRSLSNVLVLIVNEWLAGGGKLTPTPPARSSRRAVRRRRTK
jgi:hypothetical protein